MPPKSQLDDERRRDIIDAMTRRFLLGIVIVAVGVGAAVAEPTWKLDVNESSYSYVCGGGDWVAINGNGNSVAITGECALVELNGSNNKVSVESVGSIKISGNNNDVRYARA